jgi:nitroimidazol reductase NimA-like FMN-containing flavoprotein (pyridoxamine 5'-phosphate oxidase superfamily)
MDATFDPRTGLEDLDEDECRRLVAMSTLGRLAVVVDGRPLVFPVNFALDGAAVVLRTDEGTKLFAARDGFVAFECDGIDRTYHIGWSVIMTGRAEEVRDLSERSRLERLPLEPWCHVPKPVWLRIRPQTITGRRIPLPGVHRSESREGATR